MAEAAGRQVLAWLRAREQEMTELLAQLVLAESPSLVPGSEKAGLSILTRELEEAGLLTRRLRGDETGAHLFARPRDRRRHSGYQLVLGHVDTVWPLGSVRSMSPRRDNGRFFGPGAYDMKGGLVQLVFALRALHELVLRPRLAPVVLVNSDEEIGSLDSRRHIRRIARSAARAFVLEPPAAPAGSLKTSRKGVERFEIVVKGRAAHAGSRPEEGVSAILELSHQVQRLFALSDPEHGVTVNVGTIDGGLRANVVAPEATALVDVRTPTEASARAVARAIQSLEPARPGTTITVRRDARRPPMRATGRNRALLHRARRLGQELDIRIDEAPLVGGASDANLTSGLTATLDGLGAVGDGAHAPDEYVVVSALPERAALLALLLLEDP
ncbi:MAG TPA: M20 family metallopeptidase [Gaiellaceae bacterium]|nr:M20 family metallopeptidase [Gaiellaceae bacterium]